jgi:DNA-binding transcriptional LysR family regulator
MELRHLEYFTAVAEERHFTRAAAKLHVAQSALSESIRGLEAELGTTLFERSTRRVDLTEAGRTLLVEARRTLAAAADARAAVAAVEGLQRGHLSVGILQNIGTVRAAVFFGQFRRRHPGVQLQLRQASAATLAAQVRDGTLDLAFVALPADRLVGLDVTPLSVEPFLLCCSPSHPLASRRSVDLPELAAETFVEFQADWAVRMVADRAFAALGIHRTIAVEVNDTGMLLDLVAHDLGIAVVPPPGATYRTSAVLVPLKRPAPVWELSIVSRPGGPVNPAARALMELLPVHRAG